MAGDCNGGKSFEGLNITNMCNRSTIDVLIMTITYLFIVIIGLISNGSVILASIFERWKEIDQFTFVMAVSQAFCHFLFALLIYPMGLFSVLQEEGWSLGSSWCWQTALLGSYFEIMYILHIIMLGADIIIGRFTKLKDKVFVALSKQVALFLWFVALLPQLFVFFKQSRANVFGYSESDGKNACYATYMYPDWNEFGKYVAIFILIPTVCSVTHYVCLLHRSNKKNGNESGKGNKNRSFWLNYRTSFIMIILYAISQFPRWIYIFLTIAIAMEQIDLAPDYRVADFIVVWSSFGSILIPFGYLVTCPTYFSQVTQFTWMAWLKRFEPYLYKTKEVKKCPETSPSDLTPIASSSREDREDETETPVFEIPASEAIAANV